MEQCPIITTAELAGNLSNQGELDNFIRRLGIDGLSARILNSLISQYPVGLTEGKVGEDRTPEMVGRMLEYALYRLPPIKALLKEGENERHIILTSDPDYMLPEENDERIMGFAPKRRRRYEDADHSLLVENRGIIDLFENLMMFGTLTYAQEYYRNSLGGKEVIRNIFYRYCSDCGINNRNDQTKLFYQFLRNDFILHNLSPDDQYGMGELPNWLKQDRATAYAQKVFTLINPRLEGKDISGLYFLNDFAMRNFLSMGLLYEQMPNESQTLKDYLLSHKNENAFQDIRLAIEDLNKRYPNLDEKQKALFIDHALIPFVSKFALNGNGNSVLEIKQFADRLKQGAPLSTLIESNKSPVSDSIYLVDFGALSDNFIQTYIERYGETQVGFLREYKSHRTAFILLPYALGDVSYGLTKVFSEHYPEAIVMETGKVGNFASVQVNLSRATPVIPIRSHEPLENTPYKDELQNHASRTVDKIQLPEVSMATTLGLLLQAIPDMLHMIEQGMSDPLALDMELAWMISALRDRSIIRADYISDGTRAENMDGVSIVNPLGSEGWHGMLIAMLSVLQGYNQLIFNQSE